MLSAHARKRRTKRTKRPLRARRKRRVRLGRAGSKRAPACRGQTAPRLYRSRLHANRIFPVAGTPCPIEIVTSNHCRTDSTISINSTGYHHTTASDSNNSPRLAYPETTRIRIRPTSQREPSPDLDAQHDQHDATDTPSIPDIPRIATILHVHRLPAFAFPGHTYGRARYPASASVDSVGWR
ncbi:hypothetical protein BGY98DRAFT_609980 [Russula aff. rugulosa BPL654]|nr:hypothetical protein BGY98DRAFT_609980 [Russula aff. rugulosa BPL654]